MTEASPQHPGPWAEDPLDQHRQIREPSSSKLGLVRWQERPVVKSADQASMSAALSMRLRTSAHIVVLHAPAGFGKSRAMIAEFERLEERGAKAGWIAGEALAVAGLPLDEALSAIRAMADGLDVIFFDDPDRVDAEILATLVTIIVHTSSVKRLVMGVRRLDDLHLSRRILQGTADIIGGDALSWPRRQISAMWQGKLATAQIRAVSELAEGWPAATQMLACWLANGGLLDEAGLYLTQSNIDDYVQQEVVSKLPERLRAVLSATSLAPKFDQRLLDLLSPEKPVRLSEIAANLSSLVSGGSQLTTWRYNHLLRRVLCARFERLPREERKASLRLVADWAADRGDVVSAAHLASIAGDEQRIVDFTKQAGGLRLWLNQGYDTIRALVEVAGEALIRSEPRLQLLHCVVLLKDGQIGAADRLFREAVGNLPPGVEAERDAAIVEATLLIYGCRAASAQDDALFRRLTELCTDPAWSHFPPTIQAIRHYQMAEFGPATAAIVESLGYSRMAGSNYQVFFLDLHAANVALAKGALLEAAKILTRARRRLQTEFADDQGAVTVLSALAAQLDFERGRLRQAARHLKLSAHRLPHSEAWLDIYVAGFEPMMRLLGEEHGLAAAVAAIERSRQQLQAQSLERIADLLTSLGVCMEGEAWLHGKIRHPTRPGPTYSLPPMGNLATWQEREFGALAVAYQALMAGEPEIARRGLDDLIEYARERGLTRTLQRALLVRTATHDRLSNSEAGQVDLEEAVAIARSTGLRRAFEEFGGPSVVNRMSVLRASEDGSSLDPFLKGLARSPLSPSRAHSRSLTKRERQILDELVVGGSDKTIARRLAVTEHAVRFHLKNVYAKLAVHNRAEAVAKGLKPPGGAKKPTR